MEELKLEYYTNVKAAQDFTNNLQAKLLKEESKRIDAASENTKQIQDERQIAASKLAKENSAQDAVLEHMQTQWRRQLTASKIKQTKEHNKEVTKKAKKMKKDATESRSSLNLEYQKVVKQIEKSVDRKEDKWANERQQLEQQ